MGILVTQVVGTVTVVHFGVTSILDEQAVQSFKAEIEAIADVALSGKLLIDLSRVSLMTSAMVGQFVKFKKYCDNTDLELKLCSLSPELAKLFKMTKLNKVFSIYADRDKAIKAFK